MTQENPRIRVINTQTPEQQAFNRERVRRNDLRMDHLVPIYLMWTDEVPPAEANAALQGVEDALTTSGQDRQLIVLGNEKFGPPNQHYSSPEWYVNEAKQRQKLKRDVGFGEQVDVMGVMRLFVDEPYQINPHWEVFVLNQDLNARGDNGYLNFVFGSTNPEFAASVQSVRRLMEEVEPGPLRLAMVRRLLRHEVGHMFRVPLRDKNTTQLLGKHCTNVCTMKQGMSIQEWASNTLQEENKGVHFCGDCQADFARLKDHYKPLPTRE